MITHVILIGEVIRTIMTPSPMARITGQAYALHGVIMMVTIGNLIRQSQLRFHRV